jgi:hypothetical protein
MELSDATEKTPATPGIDPGTFRLLVQCDRNVYQEYFLGGKGGRCVGLTTLPPSRTDFLQT